MPSAAKLSEIEQRVCAELSTRHEAMVADLSAHVAIPTGYNHGPGLTEYRAAILQRLEALGGKTRRIPGEARPDWIAAKTAGDDVPETVVCAKRRADGGEPDVLIAGHLDTVFDPEGPFRAMTISSDGKTANGPGVVDMKGGILVAVNALEALASAGADIAWSFLLNADEETGSYHSNAALRAVSGEHRVGLALEPALPGGELAVERKGSGQFIVEAFGRSAHAGRAFFEGASAVYALARTLTALEGLSDAETGVTVNVGPLKGGEATNAVPDYAAAWGNVRFPTKELGDRLGAAMDGLSDEAGAMPRVEIRRSFSRPAKPLIPETEALALRARAAAEDLGQELPFAHTGGVCDGNIMQDAGLPTIDTLGVRGGDLHRTSEWIDLSSLVERSQLLAVLLLRLNEDPSLGAGS